jgi:hypothetical protein
MKRGERHRDQWDNEQLHHGILPDSARILCSPHLVAARVTLANTGVAERLYARWVELPWWLTWLPAAAALLAVVVAVLAARWGHLAFREAGVART